MYTYGYIKQLFFIVHTYISYTANKYYNMYIINNIYNASVYKTEVASSNLLVVHRDSSSCSTGLYHLTCHLASVTD